VTTSRLRLAIAPLVLAAAAAAQGPTPPSFQFERPIRSAGGPHRLAIDVPLIVGGNPFRVASTMRTAADRDVARTATGGVSDLRLFDASGKEVPYLLVPNPAIEPAWRPAAVLPIAAVETEKEKTSGFEADLERTLLVDRLRLEALPPPYLKRIRLEGSGDRARWTLLVGEGTVFDLPDSDLRQTTVSFIPGSYRYLRLTWDDTRSARIARMPVVSAREVTTASPAPPRTTPVAFERRPSEPGRSRFRLRLPGGRLPLAALTLDVAGARILRDAEVVEARLTGVEAAPAAIGRGTLKRVEQGDIAAAALRLPIEAPVEAQLDLVVDDGNNPPLDLRGVAAEFAELPWIYFEAAEPPVVARYGNASLAAPSYDLEAARSTLQIETIADAAWGEARTRTADENASTPAPPLPIVGAPVDAAAFRFVRDIPPGDAGLVAVRIDAAALAHSRGPSARFADVRIIDAESRQIAYLVERVPEPLSIDVSPVKLSARPVALGRSQSAETIYRIDWPYEGLPSPRLVLTTSARVFRRRIQVVVERPGDRRRRDPWGETIGTASWVNADQERPAPPLVVPVAGPGSKEVLLVVEEGDNTPLPIASARLLLPSYRMRLFRSANQPLRLAYGRSDLPQPSYDLALLAQRVFGVAAVEVVPGPERGERAGAAAIVSPRVFWAILVVAVVVLVGLIGRLMRKPAS
jgi:uncharacterized protein DUF3999